MTLQSLPQTANAALMVRPAAFAFNPETAASNRFQDAGGMTAGAAHAGRTEADVLANALSQHGIRVCQVQDDPDLCLPDAVFPNNWVSFHRDGTVVLYPMLSPKRRAERRQAVIEEACARLGFRITRQIDLTHWEQRGRFLEGTGSLVLDHERRIAFACRSPRTDSRLVHAWCNAMGYTPQIFGASSEDGYPVYHTNVLLWIGSTVCGVGRDWIATVDCERILGTLADSGRQVLELPDACLRAFAGNMLELRGAQGPVLVMSSTACASLGPMLPVLEQHVHAVVQVPVSTIERLGGGSVRCMIAEVPV
ncbi:MAG: hypothetical protein RL026_1489 [Pseudomonadota bacterium]